MMRTRTVLTVGLILGQGLVPLRAGAAEPDPTLGKWYGTVRAGDNQSPFGLEITADDKGELSGALYLEVMSFFGQALPPLKRVDSKLSVPEFGLELTRDGDRMSGALGRATVELSRVTSLPTEPPIPADLPPGPGPRWKSGLGAAIYATPAVRDGIAYVGTSGGVFNAVRVKDGSFAWTFSAGRPIMGEALVTADAVYFVCDNGFLFRLGRDSGREVWRYDLGDAQAPRILPHAVVYDYDHAAPSPVLLGDTLFVGSGDASFHAVDARSGQRVWRVPVKGKVRSTALSLGQMIIFGTWGGELHAVDRLTGKDLWVKDMKAPITSTPTLIGPTLVVGSRGSALVGLNPQSGAVLWTLSFWGSWVESTAVAGDDGLGYVGSSDLRRVTCFDPRDGRIVWRTDVYGAPWGRPLVTERFVYDGASAIVPYMTRHAGGVVALDRRTGKLAWRFPLANPPGTLHYGFAGSPALAGDVFLIGGLDGALYAFPLS